MVIKCSINMLEQWMENFFKTKLSEFDKKIVIGLT